MSMISFDAGSHRFHLRAAAIVVRGDDVLLHRAEGARELVFDWFARSALEGVDLRPSFLVQALAAQDLGFTHVLQRDENAG